MKQPVRLLLLCLALLAPAAHATLPSADSEGNPLPTLAPMLERTIPAVVNVFTETRVAVRGNPLFNDPFFRNFFNLPEQRPRERKGESLGSGVVVDAEKGYILTNHHVIEHAVEISVNLSDGHTLRAELVGSDPETDIAVIRVDNGKLTALPMADSDRLRVGDFAVAIGNPFGLGQTVTSGIISALGRTGLGIEGYEDFIQTDASINPGNSGGALVNLRGELIGINTAILSKSGGNVGIGFAIPINMARQVMQQLVNHGSVERGQLGAQAQDLTPALAAAFGLENRGGAVVTRIDKDSAAARAGLLIGDVITAVNGRRVSNAADLRTRIGLLRVGAEVVIEIVRDGEPMRLSGEVHPPRMSRIPGDKLHPRLSGTLLADIVEGMPHYGRVEGVLVLEADRDAVRAGLRKGDVITQANRKKVSGLAQLRASIKRNVPLLLNVQRGDSALFLLLR